ncbi:MAG: ArgE/DapE family deacylase [Spirochaetia bacterium]|jgi:acetylornithine deacetylase
MHALDSLLSKLVSIDSVNPDLVPGARGEGEIAACVAEWLRERGLEVHVEESGKPGRPNVVAIARGAGGGKALMLNAHMDTVGTAGMKAPFSAEIRGGRLYGRGAIDTKAALAAFMSATADARQAGLRGDVILTAVVDEEYASAGTEAIVKKWPADAAIVGEPTGLDIVTEHKGFAWFEIETKGVAAHGSLPKKGVDAIVKMGKVLAAIDEMSERLSAGAPHRTLGTGSIHASLIQGGQELSSYPGSCRLSIERRTIPGENVAEIEKELRAVLNQLARNDPDFKATLRMTFSRESLETSRDSHIAVVLSRQIKSITGRDAVFSGMSGWLDSALLAAAGIPTVVLGPGGEGLHGETEWVDLESLHLCREIVLTAIKDFCR